MLTALFRARRPVPQAQGPLSELLHRQRKEERAIADLVAATRRRTVYVIDTLCAGLETLAAEQAEMIAAGTAELARRRASLADLQQRIARLHAAA